MTVAYQSVPAARFTFGKSNNDLVSVGDGPAIDNKSSTPQKGYRSPKTFCQTMETPAHKAGSPMLIGVGEDFTTRDVPESVTRMTCGCVWTWGSGECEQLAVRSDNLNEYNQRERPIIIKALNEPTCQSIAAGAMHNLAIINEGRSLLSWGCNDEGALGRPLLRREDHHNWREARAPPDNPKPTHAKAPGLVWNVPQEAVIVRASAGGSHSALITATGDCFCWGSYRDGLGSIGFPDFERGTGSSSWYVLDESERRQGQPVPTRVPGLKGVCVELVSGENHTAVLTASKNEPRRLYVWGAADLGQTGIEVTGHTEEERRVSLFPVEYTLSKWQFHVPQFGEGQEVKLVPHPNQVQLQNGTLLHLYAGKDSTFFSVDVNGTTTTFGFGKNACGELGAGFIRTCVSNPVPVKALKGLIWQDIRGGQFFTIGLACDGSVFTWGRADLVGLGSEVAKAGKPVTEPRLVPGLRQRVVAIEAAQGTSFALTRDGQLFAWGESQNYQIGDGHSYENPVLKPVKVSPVLFDFGVVTAIGGGALHTIALVKPWPSPSKKRARSEWEESEDLGRRDHKRARVKEHQVNTDHLPSLSNPLVHTGPPSTTLQVPPPTPNDSQDVASEAPLVPEFLPPSLSEAPVAVSETSTAPCSGAARQDAPITPSLGESSPRIAEQATAIQSTVEEETPSEASSGIANDTPVKKHKMGDPLVRGDPPSKKDILSQVESESAGGHSEDEAANEVPSKKEAKHALGSAAIMQPPEVTMSLSQESQESKRRSRRGLATNASKQTKKPTDTTKSESKEEPSRGSRGRSLKEGTKDGKKLAPQRSRKGGKNLEEASKATEKTKKESGPTTEGVASRTTSRSMKQVSQEQQEEQPKRQLRTRKGSKTEETELLSVPQDSKGGSRVRRGSKSQAAPTVSENKEPLRKGGIRKVQPAVEVSELSEANEDMIAGGKSKAKVKAGRSKELLEETRNAKQRLAPQKRAASPDDTRARRSRRKELEAVAEDPIANKRQTRSRAATAK